MAAAGTWPRAQSSITLQPATSPASGQPGVHNITITGSNYPAGTIPPANVLVSLAPATPGAGPSATTAALAIQTIVGSTRRVTFQIASPIVLSTATAYRVSISGSTSTGITFTSGNTAGLTVNPPPSLTSIDPAGANHGQTLSIALATTFTNFVQGSTQASFGPGVSVGGAAAGGFGPVTVTGATSATAQIVVDAAATPGPRTVTVRTGAQQATRNAGFTVTQPNRSPVAHAGGPYAGGTGRPIAFDASGSSDPDSDALTYAWTFGDGGTGDGVAPTHTYTSAGSFTATVTVSDGRGGTHTATASVTIALSVLALTVTEPAEGQVFAASPIVVRGTVSDAAARVVVQNVVASVTGTTFEAPNVALAEGANELLVRARNDRGEVVSLVRRVTLDTIAPAIAVTSPSDRLVSTTPAVTVNGQVSDDTAVSCDLAGQPLTLNAGAFSAAAPLEAGRNDIAIACRDAAGNLAGRTLTIFFDEQPLTVVATDPADRATSVPAATPVTVTFSEPIDPQSATATTIVLSSDATVLPASLAVSPDARTVTLTATSPLPQGSRIDLAVTTGVSDALGIPVRSPFHASFVTAGAATASGTVAGEAFDDTRSLPLASATAEAFDETGTLVTSTTDAEGRYLLVPARAQFRVRVSKAGFTAVERAISAASAPLTEILDARPTPLAPAEHVNDLLGATVTTAAGDEVRLLPGALGGDGDVHLTPVSEQGPQSPFPSGWRPLGIVDLAAPRAFAQPATLTIADRAGTGAGTAAVLARYDSASARWLVLATTIVDATGTATLQEVNGPGQFALLVADVGAGSPPPAVAGSPLPAGEPPGTIPESVSATGIVTPAVGRGDDATPASAQVTISAQEPLRSGTILRGDFVELFLLRAGGRVTPLGSSQDLVAYRATLDPDGRVLAARFPIAPSRTFAAAELSEGTITVTIARSDPPRRTLVGAAGGGVVTPDGSRLLVPAGALSQDAPVSLRRIGAESFAVQAPPGFTLAGGLEIDLGGATTAAALTLTLGGAGSLVPSGSRAIVAEVRTVMGRERLVFIALARIDGDGLTTIASLDGVTFHGARHGGRFAFFRADDPLALVSGSARDAGGRRDGHLVELDTTPFVAITDAAGVFVLASPPVPFVLVATSATTRDRVRIEGQPGTPIPEIVIGPTPPRVERITVRLPRAEGNFAGPVVLLGKPAPIVDDDNTGQSVGDGDGVIEAGERIELHLTVRNDGTAAMAGGAFALRVRAPTGAVTVEPLTFGVDRLQPDVARAIGPFVFQVPPAADPALLRYELTYFTGGGVSNIIPFELPLGADHIGVPLGSEITVELSEPVTLATLAGGVTLAREVTGGTEPIAVRLLVNEDASIVTIRPQAPLAQDSRFRLTLAATIVDEDGHPLAAAPVVERFTTEDRTPPAAIEPGRIELVVPDAAGFATMTGSIGSVNPDDIVIVLNETTGFSVLATVDAQGAFTARVRADVWDQITVLLRDRHGNETRVTPGPFVRRHPVTGALEATVIGRSGGTVSGDGGLQLVVPAGALPGATELRIARVADTLALPPDLASDPVVAAAFQSRFTVVDRVRIDGDRPRFLAAARLVLPAPAGTGPSDRFVVVKSRSVPLGGALADLDAVTGTPLAQNPRRTVERLEIVESGSVKTVDGALVLSTDSPPFAGIVDLGVFTVLRVLEPLRFVTGDVRRDSASGAPLAGATVRPPPADPAMAPFAAVTNDRGTFVVADSAVPVAPAAGSTVSTRLDVTEPELLRVIRRDVRAVVQSAAPPNTTIALASGPFLAPSVLPSVFTSILGDLEPPVISLGLAGPSLAGGFARVGDTLTATVTAQDNDSVTSLGLELNQGAGFAAVQLSPGGTFAIAPAAPALLTFRARARDPNGNESLVQRVVRVANAAADGTLVLGALPGPPALVEPETQAIAFDTDLVLPISEPLDPQTVNAAAIDLRDPEGNRVAIDVVLEAAGTVIRIDPRRHLRMGACYTLGLASSIADPSGAALSHGPLAFTVPAPVLVATIPLPDAEDVALAGDLLMAVNRRDNGGGALHTFRVTDESDTLLSTPVEITRNGGMPTRGRPLSLAVDGGLAYVGNRWIGPIATKQPILVPFIPFAHTPSLDTVLGCGVDPTLIILCQGIFSIWQDLPQPPSNVETFDLSAPEEPRTNGGLALNSIPPDLWNPNTWPDRLEVTDQGLAVLNFGENVELLTPHAQPTSLGVVGRIRRYGEITPDLRFTDATFLPGLAVILEQNGVRIAPTQGLGFRMEQDPVTTLGFEEIAGAGAGRLGSVSGFEWMDDQAVRHRSDLVFVATRSRGLEILAIRDDVLGVTERDPVPLTTSPLTGVFGTFSFDPCRAVAYLRGPRGALHVVDFSDPRHPVDLNDPGAGGTPFAVPSLGDRVDFNGGVNRSGVFFVHGENGIAVIQTRQPGSLGAGCQAGTTSAPATALLSDSAFAVRDARSGLRVVRAVTDGLTVVELTFTPDAATRRRIGTGPVQIEMIEPGRGTLCTLRDTGGLFATLDGALDPGAAPSTTVQRLLTGASVTAYYRVPPHFRCVARDRVVRSRRLEFRISAPGLERSCARAGLELVRPPVLLVHGYNSNASMWNGFPLVAPAASLTNRDGLNGPVPGVSAIQVDATEPWSVAPLELYAADYFTTRQGRIHDNAVLLEAQAQRMMESLERRGIAARRFDVVTHSMGAPVTRRMSALNPGRWPVGGPVRRFITLNGVHIGSSLADLFFANKETTFNFRNSGLLSLTCTPGVRLKEALRDYPVIAPDIAADLRDLASRAVDLTVPDVRVRLLLQLLLAVFPAEQIAEALAQNAMTFDLDGGSVEDMQTTRATWPAMTGSHVHTIAAALDQDPEALAVTDFLVTVIGRGAIRLAARKLAERQCPGIPLETTSEPAFFASFSFQSIFGEDVGHDIAVSSLSQAGGFAGDDCSLFGGRGVLLLPPCTETPFENRATQPNPFRQSFGGKHLALSFPGRSLAESQKVALKIAELLDLGDLDDPAKDHLNQAVSYGLTGRFRRGFD